MTPSDAYPEGFSEQDILFECPNCSKSLGIDQRGAGLVVKCPDCGTRLRVPMPEYFAPRPDTPAEEGQVSTPESESATPQDAAHRLEVSLEALQRRKDTLEHERVQTGHRVERLREEVAVMQTAVDRMVEILQDFGPAPR